MSMVGKVLLIGDDERVLTLTETLGAYSNELATYSIDVACPSRTSEVVRGGLVDPWDVIVFDGASMLDAQQRPTFDALIAVRSCVPPHTHLLYVAPNDGTPELLWRAFEWADDVVRRDELFELAFARRTENAALARARIDQHVRWRSLREPRRHRRVARRPQRPRKSK